MLRDRTGESAVGAFGLGLARPRASRRILRLVYLYSMAASCVQAHLRRLLAGCACGDDTQRSIALTRVDGELQRRITN